MRSSQVKTNRPERYLVRPNQGLLEPGATSEISIMIVPGHVQCVARPASLPARPCARSRSRAPHRRRARALTHRSLLKEAATGEPPTCKDKFLVQSTAASADTFAALDAHGLKERVTPLNEFWAEQDASAVTASKLLVTWRFIADEPPPTDASAPIPSLATAKDEVKRSLARGGAPVDGESVFEQLRKTQKTCALPSRGGWGRERGVVGPETDPHDVCAPNSPRSLPPNDARAATMSSSPSRSI